MRTRFLILTILVALLGAGSATGLAATASAASQGSQAKSVLSRFGVAVARSQGSKACGLMDSYARRQFVTLARRYGATAKSCSGTIIQFQRVARTTTSFARARVASASVSVKGSRATVTFKGSTVRAILVKSRGRWLVHNAGIG